MSDGDRFHYLSDGDRFWEACVYGSDVTADRVATYLPARWDVVSEGVDHDGRTFVRISGEDHAGWTFRDYVEPRLASGLLFCSNVVCSGVIDRSAGEREAIARGERELVTYCEDCGEPEAGHDLERCERLTGGAW